jgi:intergrase/recombinase
MGGIGKHLGVISYEYLRKFAFDNMASEKLNVPESVADFIEGRTPKTIGARHYMQLKRKAVQFYQDMPNTSKT